MLNSLIRKVQSHPLWALGWAVFTGSVVFFAGEYNATEENTLALDREFQAVKAKRAELSEAFDLMRQQQAFFSFYKRREDAYKSSNLHTLSRKEREERIASFLDEFGEMRSDVGGLMAEIRATSLDHPRLNHAKELALGDLQLADELLQTRIGVLERARLNRRVFIEERATADSLIHQERLRRMWEDVDARGSQARNLLLRVDGEIQSDSEALLSKAHAGMRRTYVRWAAIGYILIFLVAFPIWLVRSSGSSRRNGTHPAAKPGPVEPPASTTKVPEPRPAATQVSPQPPNARASGALPVNPYQFVADLTRKRQEGTRPPSGPSTKPSSNDS